MNADIDGGDRDEGQTRCADDVHIRSATLSLALRARLLLAISASVGTIGRRVIIFTVAR